MEHRIEARVAERMAAPVATEVEKLRLKFPGSPDLLFRDLSLKVFEGEKVLLLGPSGCGKSTLLQVLGGIIPRVNEVPLKAERLSVPKSVGIVFQDPDTQFCMPYVDEELAFVLENLAVPQAEMRARIESALREVGLNLPDPHVPIGSLSQGMKQRLALASALLLEPDTLLLDEPSALLDPEGRRTIWEAVRRVSEKRTVIIVEHRIEEVLDWVDRVVLFKSDGSILADAPASGIFRRYRSELREYGIWYPEAWNDAYASAVPNHTRSPAGNAAPAPSTDPLLRLEDFRVSRGGKVVCTAESAVVRPGDLIALTGPNGAGKSSLLLGMMGLLPHEGDCEYAGMPIRGRRELREAAANHAAFVFQNPEFQFVTNRALDEIAFTLRGEVEAALRKARGGAFARWVPAKRGVRPDAAQEADILWRAAGCLENFGLGDYAERHPYLLSLGQKRRLSVASAIVSDKPLLLLDEPTFGQDARNAFAILDLCERLRASGHAVLMITHEMEIAERLATQIWQIENGKLAKVLPTGRSRTDSVRLSKGGEA